MKNYSTEKDQVPTALKHDKYTIIYTLSRLFERLGFYGFRAIIVLFMVSDPLNLSDIDAINIYSLFGASIIISPIVGAIFGDLLIGNKRAILIGAILQVLGTFALCLYTVLGLYIGLIFITIGSGLYSPNLIAHFGKLYLSKTKLLDAAFTILYSAINIGSFIGVLFIGFIADEYGFRYGFIISGISYLVAFCLLLILKEYKIKIVQQKSYSFNRKLIFISLAFFFTATYWGIYDTLGYTFNEIKSKIIDLEILDIPTNMLYSIESIMILPISIILAIIWSYFYSNQFVKLAIGFILGSIAIWLFFNFPDFPTDNNIGLYFIAVLLLVISELFISPIIQSILTKYSKPKYLAIIISISSILYKVVYILIGFILSNRYIENSTLTLKFGLVVFCSISIGLLLLLFIFKKLKLD